MGETIAKGPVPTVRRRKGPPLLASRRTGESGQALLELALVTPILALLVMAIFQFAFVLQTQMGLENAVREAARRTAATTDANPAWAALRTWTLLQLNGDGTPANPGLLAQNVQAYDAGKLWPAPYPAMSNTTTPAVSFCSYAAAGVTNYRIQITVEYQHPLFFGVMAFATDLVDGHENGAWDLGAAAEMRLENVDPAAAAANDPGTCPRSARRRTVRPIGQREAKRSRSSPWSPRFSSCSSSSWSSSAS
jgi:hypothetical protein